MPGPTDQEQLLLELINEARIDPLRNAARYITSYSPLASSNAEIQNAIEYFNVAGAELLAAYRALTPVAPLAWNDKLATAAEKHGAAMIAADEQSHQIAGELGLGDRIRAEGYTFTRAGENVYSFTENLIHGHAGFMIDWGDGPGGMQSPAGHRANIMSPNFSEVGIDVTAEHNRASDVGPLLVTQDFGERNLNFILGVAYSDIDQDRFYSPGEGRGDLQVSIGNISTTSAASGGYSLAAAAGLQTVTLTGGGLAGPVTVHATIGADNLKLDIVDGTTLLTSGSVTAGGAIQVIRGVGTLGGGLTITAGAGDQRIVGAAGNDTLAGGDGNDILEGGAGDDALNGGGGKDVAVFTGTRAQHTVAALTGGRVTVTRGDGRDTLDGVEVLRFADGDFFWNAALGQLTSGANAAPTLAGSQAVAANEDTAQQFTVAAVDADGDALTYTAGPAAQGNVSGGVDGVFTYTPPPGYTGIDSFVVTVTDGKGGSAAQVVTVSITGAPPAPAGGDDFKLFATDGFAGQVGGEGTVFGTRGFQEIAVVDRPGGIYFDPSFNRGGDVIRLAGSANGYTVALVDSFAVLEDGDTIVTIPLGTVGTTVVFDDGARTLVIAGGSVKLGDQTLAISPAAIVATPENSPLPEADPGAMARTFLAPGASVALGGRQDVFGTTVAEEVTYLGGDLVLDPSFNRGGDTLFLPETTGAYSGSVVQSSVVLLGGDGSVSLPIGVAGMSIDFAGEERTLRIVGGTARLGDEALPMSDPFTLSGHGFGIGAEGYNFATLA